MSADVTSNITSDVIDASTPHRRAGGRRHPVWAKTRRELASLLGISTTTVIRYLDKVGAPRATDKGWNVLEVREFINQVKEGRNKLASSPRLVELRCAELAERHRKIKMANDRMAGLLIERAKVEAAIATVIDRARAILEARLVNEYPSMCAGLDVVAARIYGRKLADEIAAEMAKLSLC